MLSAAIKVSGLKRGNRVETNAISGARSDTLKVSFE